MDITTEKWFEQIWADREERLYREFFGDTGPGIFTIPEATFVSLGCGEIDPRFLTHGVLECPPGEKHADWIYVTSGMSNAWGESPASANPAGPSGLGYEFTVHARERARWPIQLLQWLMAVQLLTAAGMVKGELLQRHDRIPLGGSLGKKDGLLTHLLAASPADRGLSEEVLAGDPVYPPEFALASGRVEFLLIIGVTKREAEFAQSQSAEGLITLLRHRGVFPITDPARQGAV